MSIQNRLVDAINENNKVVQLNTKSFKKLESTLASHLNVTKGFSEAFKRSEELQLRSLAQGTTYLKFTEANTEALNKTTISQQAMTDYLLTGFDQGVRNLGDETINLIDVMHLSNQNAKALLAVQSRMSLLTGDSHEIQESLSKTLHETNKDYGVSTDKLIKTLDTLSAAMKQQSIYGQDAVKGISELGIVLKGGLAGKEGADQMISQLLSMGDALNVMPQELLGLRDLFKDIRSGTGTMDEKLAMIIEASESLEEQLLGASDETRQAIMEAFGRDNATALMFIGDTLKKDQKTAEEYRVTEEDYRESMRNFEESKKKWYETWAPEIHTTVTKIMPMLMAQQAIGATNAGKKVGWMGLGVATKPGGGALAGGLGRGMMGLGKVLSVLGGPVGMGAMAAISIGLPLLTSLFEKNVDNTDTLRKEADERAARERRARLSTEASIVASTIRGYIQADPNSGDMKKLVKLMQKAVNRRPRQEPFPL